MSFQPWKYTRAQITQIDGPTVGQESIVIRTETTPATTKNVAAAVPDSVGGVPVELAETRGPLPLADNNNTAAGSPLIWDGTWSQQDTERRWSARSRSAWVTSCARAAGTPVFTASIHFTGNTCYSTILFSSIQRILNGFPGSGLRTG